MDLEIQMLVHYEFTIQHIQSVLYLVVIIITWDFIYIYYAIIYVLKED